ncbi:hypothetical protein NSS79_12510 [Paenibacillus sp. FSL L8-0436]|uniref:hypothetical protein n=1 Tax=Paenibacillus sp. FSL L8-0436 TaxID=2954686 RepID=UPI00315824EA
MTIKSRRKAVPGRRGRFLLILCLCTIGLSASSAFPAVYAAKDTRVTVTQAVSHDALASLAIKTQPSTESLQDFTKLTIRKLSADAPFTSWKEARTDYYPLGPGTHSWLVNIMDGGQRIGYLIVSATEQGGYMLSEYGTGTSGLPYSLTDLRQFLVQEELISSDYSGKLELTPLYASLLPVWKLTLDHTDIYINASVPQVLPWSSDKAEEVLKVQFDGVNTISGLDSDWSPLQTYRSEGLDDPYADLQWLTSPKLKLDSAENFTVLLNQSGSLVFQSAGRNDTTGAPFMITGYQRWLPAGSSGKTSGSSPAIVYAAAGPKGKRYLPLSALQQSGTLHQLPLAGKTVIGALTTSKR